jgi:hypothetical protein
MKRAGVFFLTVLLFLSPVFAGSASNEGAETFLLMEESPVCLSFENYHMRDGWTPVVLSIGELDCLLWMHAAGRVSELPETGAHFVEPVCFIDESTQSLRKGSNTLYFDVYDQNQVRTRWRLSPGGTVGTVTKKILFREGGIDLCLGNLKLQLNHVAWDFQELSPGLFQVEFHGPMLLGHRELVVEKAKGIIYTTHGRNNRLPTGPSRTWTTNPNRPASGSIPPQERAALIALYNSTDGDNWINKSGWKTPPLAGDGFALPGTENTWHGITCDPGNTTVQSISLNYNNLNGTLPPQLGNLDNLLLLFLGVNQLSGTIPPELGNLTKLICLGLGSNQLSGSIPFEFTNLTNLDEEHGLYLNWNALYTNDDILKAFLDSKNPDWEKTQTIAPSDVTTATVSTSSIDINWTPILYTYNTGGYMVFYSTTPGGPYTYFGITANKTASSLTITGLNPGTTYYFVVQTRTYSHGENPNTVDSEYSAEVSASTLNAVTISGIVTIDGSGLPDVSIILSDSGRSTVTDAHGNYSITVPYGWTGTATPSKAGYNFSPPNRSYTNVTVNQTNQVYIALLQTITIAGKATSGASGLPDVFITLSDSGRSTVTDAYGNYSITVPYGWTGTTTPSKPGYYFLPSNRSYTNVIVNQTKQNFQGNPVTNLTLASPNGGELWGLGTVHNITWNSSGLPGKIRLELWKADKKVRNIATNIPIVNGIYPWLIGQYSPGTMPTGNDYRVKIITANGLYNDTSDGSFSIVNPYN